MRQIKIFKGLEADLDRLEKAVNHWLRESDVEVVNIFGNIAPQSPSKDASSGGYVGHSPHSPSDILLVVVYQPSPQSTTLPTAKGPE